jgi:diguanylate cyclase
MATPGAAKRRRVLRSRCPQLSTMTNASDTLLFASGALAVASVSLTAFGLRRAHQAGWAWWVAAMWLTTLGVLLEALLPKAWGTALAAPLLLQWPLLSLIGLRRFHARHVWPGSEKRDWALLTVVCVGAVAAALALGPKGWWLAAACGLLVHLYCAVMLFIGPAEEDATPMQGLGAVMALVAFAPGLTGLPSDDAWLPMNARALAAALGAIVLGFVAQTLICERTERQLRQSRRRLRTLANLDALTQVPNRRHFNELAQLALQNDAPGSAVVVMFDVDHFKLINDRLGHAAGDRALRLVSTCVQEHLRAQDVAGRHGGDEFVLLLRCADTQAAMGAAMRIASELQSRSAEHQLPPLSLSFGMVQMAAHEDIEAAVRRADQALYEAKRQGRSRAVSAQGDEATPVFSESRRLGLLAH